MGNLHSTERMKAWSWEDEKHEGRPQGTWNCWERVPRSADPAQTLVPGAGNGPVSGYQVSQECRWSRAFSIISAQWHTRTGWPSIPDLAWKSSVLGNFCPKQTGMVGYPFQGLSKTRIIKECQNYWGFLVFTGLSIIIISCPHFEHCKVKMRPSLEKGLSLQFYQYIWNAAHEIQSFPLSYSWLCVVRKVCMNWEVCDTCPHSCPWRLKSKVNTICLRVRSCKCYRSWDQTSRRHWDGCACVCVCVYLYQGVSSHPEEGPMSQGPLSDFAPGEESPLQVVPKALRNQQALDVSLSISEKKISCFIIFSLFKKQNRM